MNKVAQVLDMAPIRVYEVASFYTMFNRRRQHSSLPTCNSHFYAARAGPTPALHLPLRTTPATDAANCDPCREPVGTHLIQVCGTTPCQLNGAEAIIDTITEHLGIGRGETTKDGLFTMMEVECLGACVNAPMVQINDDFYEDLNKDRMIQVLDQLKKGGRDATKIGPQGKRVGCIGPQGKTNLHTQPNLVVSRDFAAVKAEIAAKAKAAEEEAKKEAKK